jgi:hypothetical protein
MGRLGRYFRTPLLMESYCVALRSEKMRPKRPINLPCVPSARDDPKRRAVPLAVERLKTIPTRITEFPAAFAGESL